MKSFYTWADTEICDVEITINFNGVLETKDQLSHGNIHNSPLHTVIVQHGHEGRWSVLSVVQNTTTQSQYCSQEVQTTSQYSAINQSLVDVSHPPQAVNNGVVPPSCCALCVITLCSYGD